MIRLLVICKGEGVFYDVCFVRRVEEVEVVGVDLETDSAGRVSRVAIWKY